MEGGEKRKCRELKSLNLNSNFSLSRPTTVSLRQSHFETQNRYISDHGIPFASTAAQNGASSAKAGVGRGRRIF